MSESYCEDVVRGRAKALRIRNWHNRRLEDLVELVREEEERLQQTGGVSLPLDGVMAVVGDEGRERLLAYVSALEELQGHEELVQWMDRLVVGWIVSGVDVELLWAKWKKEAGLALVSWAPYADVKRFSSLCSAWCVVVGWSLEGGAIQTGPLPPLMPTWHLKTWSDVTSAVDRRRAEQLFSVLVNG